MKSKQKKVEVEDLSRHPIVLKKLEDVNAALRKIDRSKLESLLNGRNFE